MIETVTFPELTVIGCMVEAGRDDLPAAVAAAWERVFAADTGTAAFAAVSLPEENGLQRRLVGFMAAKASEIPAGMVRVDLDAGRYLRTVQDGPVAGIADGFARLQAHAEANGLALSGIALDFGYRPGLPDGRHELHLALAPQLPALA
ncbi:GyrI-like domain-containing protein [Azospirillum sp. A1-3]|uniref:GyrI-like domain-containing protein n=1 Tax=Azospirillum sp. A1-3 TaxID=185874 RepID=UPI002077127E|nr:GyrI-like domain-containing protein [Azospirillum sp. A1-3]MCM8737132.1 GyrI-like domain-containing protein [Azospirillum sp. A1-3]